MRQTLEDAAERYAEGIPYNQDRHRNCSRDFVAGIEWLAKELWHGPDELPDISENGFGEPIAFDTAWLDSLMIGNPCISINGDGDGPFIVVENQRYSFNEVTGWCYVKDLHELFKITRCGTQDRRNI